jgi:hypothetical protein
MVATDVSGSKMSEKKEKYFTHHRREISDEEATL